MKKILAGLLSIVMFFVSLVFLSLVTVRITLSGNSMSDLVSTALDEMSENGNYNEIFGESVSKEYSEEFNEYFDEKQFEKVMGNYISEYVKYAVGVKEDMPPTDDVKEFLESIAEKYEEKTGEKIDSDFVDEVIDEMETELEVTEEIDDDVKLVMQIVFSGTLLFGSLIVILICTLLIYLLTKDAKKATRKLGVTFIIDGGLVLGISILLNKVIEAKSLGLDEISLEIINSFLKSFNTTGIIFIVSGIIIFLVASKVGVMVNSLLKSREAIENLDNSVLDKTNK